MMSKINVYLFHDLVYNYGYYKKYIHNVDRDVYIFIDLKY